MKTFVLNIGEVWSENIDMQDIHGFTTFDFFNFDFFAALILVGAVQGMFLFALLISKPKMQPFHYLILAVMVLVCAMILLEIFLGYSGLIVRVLFLVDFSEPLVFTIGPLIFLLIRSMGGEPFRKVEWLHFLPFFLYALYHLPFLMENSTVKFNSFLWAFHPDIPMVEAVYDFPFDPLHIRRNLDYFIMLHFGFYLVLAYVQGKKVGKGNESNPYFLSWGRFFLIAFSVMALLHLVIRFYYQNDLGDHILAVFLVMVLFFISYKMLIDSGFFQPMFRAKYEKSSLSEPYMQGILMNLKLLEQSEFYIDPSLSLASLAKRLGTTPHYLSQALNEGMGKTFFDHLRQLRIAKAQKMLADPTTHNLKIDEIAERSGYLSKSAFNTAFKKITGTTPGKYRESVTKKSSGL